MVVRALLLIITTLALSGCGIAPIAADIAICALQPQGCN